MGALIYVLIVFAATLVLFWVEAFAGLHVIWVLGILLSCPAFWMLWRSLWLIVLEICGKKADAKVIAVRGRDNGIIRAQYRDERGEMHEAEERAVYGIMNRSCLPKDVTVRYFQRYPNRISFGWRTLIYWLPLNMFWIAFTILCWIGFTGWGV